MLAGPAAHAYVSAFETIKDLSYRAFFANYIPGHCVNGYQLIITTIIIIILTVTATLLATKIIIGYVSIIIMIIAGVLFAVSTSSTTCGVTCESWPELVTT